LSECNDKKDLEWIILKSIEYIAGIHNKNIFHGDIKPANIFYKEFDSKISSDSGSLV